MTRNVMQLTRYFLRTHYQAYGASAFFPALGNSGTIKHMPGEFLKYFLFLVILLSLPNLIQTRTFITTGEKYGIV